MFLKEKQANILIETRFALPKTGDFDSWRKAQEAHQFQKLKLSKAKFSTPPYLQKCTFTLLSHRKQLRFFRINSINNCYHKIASHDQKMQLEKPQLSFDPRLDAARAANRIKA